jgi:uncharacterized phage protein gp47/JayE
MALKLPTYETIRSTVVAIWQSERPSADSSRYSDLWLFSRVTAKLVQRLHQSVDRALAAMFPETTWGIYLEFWLAFVGASDGSGGYGRIKARTSAGTNALAVTSTGVANIAGGEQLTDTGGRLYAIVDAHAYAGVETFNHDLISVDTGLECNLETGAVLTFVSTPANITATPVLVADLDGAADLETDAEGRARLLDIMQRPSLTNTPAGLRRIIEGADPGALRAYVWLQRNASPMGAGTWDYCALQIGESKAARVATSTQIAAMATEVTDNVSVNFYRQVQALTVTTTATDIEITIELKVGASTANQCDWDAESLKTTVASYTAATKLIQCANNINALISVGDRVFIDGHEFTVVLVGIAGGLGANTRFTFSETAPTDWVDGGTPLPNSRHVCAGGGVIKAVHDAILEYCDDLGPERGAYADSGDMWPDQIIVNGIRTAAMNASDAILDVTVAAPGADVSPTASVTSAVYLLIAGEIDVWEDKP